MQHSRWWKTFVMAGLIGAASANPNASAADEASDLAFDPTLTWTNFLGSAKNDDGYGVAVDAAGNLYLVGTSLATWGNPLRAHSGGPDLVVAKLDSSGNLLWNTFLGSQGADQGYGIALDASGNIAVVGYSDSDWGGPLRAHSGLSDILVAKLSGAGQLLWHSFLGTSEGMSAGSGVAIDSQGNLLVTGKSDADWGDALRPHAANKQPDIVVAKLGASGGLLWNTFLGSMDNDEGEAIAVDASGNAYVTGASGSPWGTPVRSFAGGKDIAAAKLNPEGALQWNTFLGSGVGDEGYGIAVTGGNLFLTGYSGSGWGSPIDPYAGDADILVARLDLNGVLAWHSFLGSGQGDWGYGIAADGAGGVFVTGTSNASWGTDPVFPFSGDKDIVAAKLGEDGVVRWHGFLGSVEIDDGYAIALGSDCRIHLTGGSGTSWGSPLLPHAGDSDIFVTQLTENDCEDPPTPFADVPPGSWAEDYINAIYAAGITGGCGNGNFCPQGLVTREQMAAFVIRALEGDPATDYCGGVAPFSDVSPGTWSCPHIKRLVELSITGGCGGTYYCPQGIVTREQVAAFIVRALEGEPPLDYCEGVAPFDDVAPTDWACRYIKRLVELGVTQGCGDGNYCPDDSVTREQMAAFLARAFLDMD